MIQREKSRKKQIAANICVPDPAPSTANPLPALVDSIACVLAGVVSKTKEEGSEGSEGKGVVHHHL